MKKTHFLCTMCLLLLASCAGEEKSVKNRQFEESCDKINDCLEGLFCESGFCRKPCTVKEDCGKGYSCQNYRCTKNSGQDGEELCGNGAEDSGEFCDDGNINPNDGCSAKCNIETGYVCAGWPSVCTCSIGYQDSNSDGHCLPDCPGCTPSQVCLYNSDGSAAGCGCADGFQDNNGDNICHPDCDPCQNNQICLYDNAGLALGCGCPEGQQDNDNDGICEVSCEKLIGDGQCNDFRACDDSSGTANCSCVIYVNSTGETAGNGTSWDNAANDLDTALASLESLRDAASDDSMECALWLTSGNYVTKKTLFLHNTAIYGGFEGTENSPDQRHGEKSIIVAIYESSTNRFSIINSTGDVTLDNLQISNGYADKMGGAVFAAGGCQKLTINNCFFTANQAGSQTAQTTANSGYGGAIYLENTAATITNSVFYNNESFNMSGAIYSNNSQLEISNTNFGDNTAKAYGTGGGGAIYAENGGTLLISDSYFTNNSGSSSGGAIKAKSLNEFKVRRTMFIGNQGAGYTSQPVKGGIIYNETDEALFDRCYFMNSFSKNSSDRGGNCGNIQGGAIYNNGADLLITNSLFSNNIIYLSNGSNSPTADGLHIYNSTNGTVNIAYSTILPNTMASNSQKDIQDIYNSVNQEFIVFNSLLDSNNIQNTTSSNCALPYTVYSNGIFSNWQEITFDEKSNTTTARLEANSSGIASAWQPGELVGKMLKIQANSGGSYYLPIIANGIDYVVFPGDISKQYIDRAPSNQLQFARVADFKTIYSDNSNEINGHICHLAKTGKGQQVTEDILGADRGTTPDIGAYQICDPTN